jgi:hypothetical protein
VVRSRESSARGTRNDRKRPELTGTKIAGQAKVIGGWLFGGRGPTTSSALGRLAVYQVMLRWPLIGRGSVAAPHHPAHENHADEHACAAPKDQNDPLHGSTPRCCWARDTYPGADRPQPRHREAPTRRRAVPARGTGRLARSSTRSLATRSALGYSRFPTWGRHSPPTSCQSARARLAS